MWFGGGWWAERDRNGKCANKRTAALGITPAGPGPCRNVCHIAGRAVLLCGGASQSFSKTLKGSAPCKGGGAVQRFTKTLKGSATVAVNEAHKRHPAFKGSRLFIFRSYGDHNAGWRANTPVALAAFGAHRRGRREEEWGDGAGMVAWMVSEGRAKHFR